MKGSLGAWCTWCVMCGAKEINTAVSSLEFMDAAARSRAKSGVFCNTASASWRTSRKRIERNNRSHSQYEIRDRVCPRDN